MLYPLLASISSSTLRDFFVRINENLQQVPSLNRPCIIPFAEFHPLTQIPLGGRDEGDQGGVHTYHSRCSSEPLSPRAADTYTVSTSSSKKSGDVVPGSRGERAFQMGVTRGQVVLGSYLPSYDCFYMCENHHVNPHTGPALFQGLNKILAQRPAHCWCSVN